MSSAAPATSQLADLRRQFEACSAAAEKLVESLSEDKIKQRPKSGGWSVGECFAHLTLTSRVYFPVLDSELQTAPPGNGPYKMDWGGRVLKWVLEPPYRSIKSKTLSHLDPGLDAVGNVLPDFLDSQRELARRMQEWDGRAQDKVFVSSLFNKRFRYNVYSLFNVIAAHQRRHVWQASRIKDQVEGN